VDAALGRVVREVKLPAAPLAPPAIKANRAWVLLADGTVIAADLVGGTILWAADPRLQTVGGPVLVDGALRLAARDGSVAALSLSNGATVWRRAPRHGGPSELGAPAFDLERWSEAAAPSAPASRLGARLYAPVTTGELIELEAATGKTLGRFPIDGAFVGLVAAPRFVLVAAGDSVAAIERSD
jgi:outer membrane protein assembly factor BamB